MRWTQIICLAAFLVGCNEQTRLNSLDPPPGPVWSAKEMLAERLPVRAIPRVEAACDPDPLPSVGWKIGDVEAYVGEEVLVPLYADTEGKPTWGGLLFVDYDADKLEIECAGEEEWCEAQIVAGPQWGFQFGIGYRPEPGKVNTVLVGWQDEPFGGVSSVEPLWYLKFTAIKPGKAHIEWRPLPKEHPEFWRRSELLTDVKCTDGSDFLAWDTVDWYRSQPNVTGATYVESGSVLIRPARK